MIVFICVCYVQYKKNICMYICIGFITSSLFCKYRPFQPIIQLLFKFESKRNCKVDARTFIVYIKSSLLSSCNIFDFKHEHVTYIHTYYVYTEKERKLCIAVKYLNLIFYVIKTNLHTYVYTYYMCGVYIYFAYIIHKMMKSMRF